ncbi:hypothetical protein EDD15DRAFT_2156567 [Pisolithus albus]|nr:hypothetical protein EDD15DRAFT_2184692 [Pisolithus albus]KAI6002135.1 hypothetical protein EDD15DRAFT_2158505 [Pisolithus albus]KAI6003819.1 hypothetical protein EDD15DRAFT_2156567 [Pisolithus albus]
MGQSNTLERMRLDKHELKRKNNPYFPFSSKDEWELGKFLYRNLSQTQIDDFLKLQWVTSKDLRPVFRTAEQLLSWLDVIPKGSTWRCTEICPEGYAMKEPIYLYWRDALEVVRDIFGNPAFAEHMVYDPYHVYEGAEREYGEWMSGDEAHRIQVNACPCDRITSLNTSQNELPDGATIVPVILASDKAPVTRMSGDREMHPLFLTIANINSEVRMKATAHAWACVAYTPIPEFLAHSDFHSILEARVWHRCMDIVCANLKVASHRGVFMADPHNNTRYCENIDPWKIREFQVAAKKQHLNGVQLPFWRDWRFSDPAIFLVGEILHACHKWFFDHVLKWCRWVLGDDELDVRYRCQHKYVGTRHFTGVSHVKQMTGREHRDIQRTIVAAIAGGADATFVAAVRAIVDFIYRAQAPTFTTSSLEAMEACLAEFHQKKHAIQEAGARRGRTGDIPHFHIPKLELFQSFGRSVHNTGSLIQYTADVSERLLITHCKNPFLRTNRKSGFTQQITLLLDREEAIHRLDLYTRLCLKDASLKDLLSTEDGAPPHTPPVVSEEYSFSGSATHRNHFLDGFISDDATTAFHVTKKPDFADKQASYLSAVYHLPDFPTLLISTIDSIAGQNSPFRSRLLRGWSKFRIQMQSHLRPLTLLPSQQVQALPPSDAHPYGKCDTVLARVTSPSAVLVVQVRAVFALSTRGNALPPALSYPFLYVQCFAFMATPSEQPEIGMYTVRRMFIEYPDGSRCRVGAIISILDVLHAVELIPRYGVTADRNVTSETSLEIYDEFYLNSFSSKEFYYAIHDDL